MKPKRETKDDFELLTTRQVAELFGVTQTAVLSWESSGALPSLQAGSTRVFVRRNVEEFRRNRERSQKKSA
jgi:excisionase family DNA binding protein